MRKSTSGFTIVELLIVIVVIAILAAITIVSYNGIQQRANNSARITAANTASRLVNGYVATYGTYPFTGSNSCIGEGFPYRNESGNMTCWGWDSATPSLYSIQLNNELKKIGSLPKISTPPVVTPYWNGVGPVWIYNTATTVDGENRPAMILYFLEGANQECRSSSPIVRQTSTNAWTTVSSPPYNTSSAGNSTWCYVTLNKA